MSATQFSRIKLSDHLVLHVCREIVRGDLAVGEKLPSEHEFATQFSISKPVVRESMRALASVGMVHVQQGKRTLVQAETEWDILEPIVQQALELEGFGFRLTEQLYELRVILETASAGRAASRATEPQIAALTRLASELSTIATGSHDLDAFLAVDREFHDMVAQASCNEALRQVVRNVNGYLTRAWAPNSISEDDLELLAGMHLEIANAIGAGDSERAGESMASHVDRAAIKEFERNLAQKTR